MCRTQQAVSVNIYSELLFIATTLTHLITWTRPSKDVHFITTHYTLQIHGMMAIYDVTKNFHEGMA